MTLTSGRRVRDTAPAQRINWLWVSVGAGLFAATALVITALRPAPKFPFVAGEGGLARRPSPVDAPYVTAHGVWAAITLTSIGLIGVAIGLRMSLRGRTLLPVMVALSAAFIVIPEVFYDVTGAVYFPFSETAPLGATFSILGRTMPVWITAGWFGYGVFALLTYAMLTVRPSTKTLWYAWGLAIVGDVVFEEALLHFDAYHYYGNQPLILIFKLPWWWIPCNSVGVMLAAAIAYRFRASLRGIGALGMVVITPVSVTAIYGLIALPSWIATNGNYSWLPTQLLGLATMVLGVLAFTGVLKLVLNRDPFDFNYRPSEEGEFDRVH